MNLKQIETVVASYVAAAKSAGVWNTTTNNLAKLVDKIAKTITIDGLFADKLEILNGASLPFGKTVEEYFQELDNVVDYNDYSSSGDAADDALKPYYPSYRPASYNYTLGRKKIPTTIKYDDYERACNNPDEFQTITNMVIKRLYDTYAVFKYNCKKQMIANYIGLCNSLKTSSTAISNLGETANPVQYHSSSTSTARTGTLVANNRYYIGASMAAATHVAICVKARASASKTWAEDIAAGNLVELNLIQTMSAVTDTATSEAFIEQVKKDVESAQFVTEGNSLNGGTIGAAEGLVLIVNKGIMPTLDVQALSGAFHEEKLALPAEVIVVDNFANDNTGAFAILTDRRSMRLHPSYMAVREQLNGAGDYMNYFLHTENTAFISRNTFVKVYKA